MQIQDELSEDGKETVMNKKIGSEQQQIAMVIMYILGIAAVSPWPGQKLSHVLFFFFSVCIASVPVIMLMSAKNIINDAVKDVKERKEGYSVAAFKKAPFLLSLSYLPMIVMLIWAGYVFSTLLWTFSYLVVLFLAIEVMKRLKIEEAYDNIASVSNNTKEENDVE